MPVVEIVCWVAVGVAVAATILAVMLTWTGLGRRGCGGNAAAGGAG